MIADVEGAHAEEMTAYEPELGQTLFGNPWGKYAMPEHAIALFSAISAEIGRVYWNSRQETWDESEDPGIPGIVWNAYWWGNEDDEEAARSNFAAEGVEIRWYKWSGRGMSANVEMDPAGWAAWFDRVMALVRAAEDDA